MKVWHLGSDCSLVIPTGASLRNFLAATSEQVIDANNGESFPSVEQR
jgi:hypothetical protein